MPCCAETFCRQRVFWVVRMKMGIRGVEGRAVGAGKGEEGGGKE